MKEKNENNVVSLSTERLVLRPFGTKDAAFILELMNTREWKEFIGERGIKNLDDAVATLQGGPIKSYAENGFGLMAMCLKVDDLVIGMCGLLKRNYLSAPDLGFALLPSYAGKGFAHEACKSILLHAKEKLKLSRILAITEQQNFRSQRLLIKLGFVQQEKILPEGENEELNLFEINLEL
jgi:RimJ/RimL family protein N-acetyltransferase